MQRRRYLETLAAGTVGLATAGCLAAPTADRVGGTAPAGRIPADQLPVPWSAFSRTTAKDAIPAIVDPTFGADWSDLEITRDGVTFTQPPLAETAEVIGVTAGDRARAYPLAVLNWHEVVNDGFGGPRLVTYCPLCRSGVVLRRRLDGAVPTFGVSGLLWRGNLVLYDRPTGSLWSQLEATAIRGRHTGTALEYVPSTLTTWAEWRRAHPDTAVLLPPPFSETVAEGFLQGVRDYSRNPYDSYGLLRSVPGENHVDDDRLRPKARVIGVTHHGVATAYPLAQVAERRVVNDVVGGRPVVVAVAGPAGEGRLVAYDRRIAGTTLAFEPVDADRMRAGGSNWSVGGGRALDGPYQGRRLDRANDVSPVFWFAWVDTHPDTTVYQGQD